MPNPRHHRTLRVVLAVKAVVGVSLACGALGALVLQTRGLTVGDWATELKQGSDPRFEWRSIDKRHWQAIAPGGGEPPEVTDAREGTGLGCPVGMARARGGYRLGAGRRDDTGDVERAQNAACTDWISRDFPARCRTFDKDKLASGVAKLPTQAMDYCIDRFEYPNRLGENPIIVVTFNEAERMCKKESKRLCTEREWTFACEGEEARPYPNGYERDPEACVVDRSWKLFAEGALVPRDGPRARAEMDRLWQAEPSGTRPKCRSPFGVYDMTGNVDEWTRSTRSTGYVSVLKGGYWGPVRARCRPATRAHNEDFVAYQQGFRCCADPVASRASQPAAALAAPDAGAAATTPDAGPGAVAATPDAGPGAVAARTPGRDAGAFLSEPDGLLVVTEDESDEDDALARTRAVGISCGARPSAPIDASVAVGLVALGAALARRRRGQGTGTG